MTDDVPHALAMRATKATGQRRQTSRIAYLNCVAGVEEQGLFQRCCEANSGGSRFRRGRDAVIAATPPVVRALRSREAVETLFDSRQKMSCRTTSCHTRPAVN